MSKRTIGEHFLENTCSQEQGLSVIIKGKTIELSGLLPENECAACPDRPPYHCPVWKMTLEELEG